MAAKQSSAAIDREVESLLAQLTSAEKVSLMAGAGMFRTQAIERLNIPALRFSDGPSGVRLN